MRYFFIVLFATTLVSSCNQDSPTEYNDSIINRQTKVVKNFTHFIEIYRTNVDSASQLLNGYVLEIDQMIKEIKAMPPHKGDSSLRDVAIASFKFYRKVLDEDYKAIIAIHNGPRGGTLEGQEEIKRILQGVSIEGEKYDKDFHNAQVEFAKKNNMKLRDNELQEEADKKKGN